MKKHLFLVIALFSGLVDPAVSQKNQHWSILKKYLQKEIQVISADKSVLVIAHPGKHDTLHIGLQPCDECDITGVIEQKKGDNPYRVWVAHDKFWSNKARPQSAWGQYFRASFLRILRPPPTQEP
ncbi:MAG: hypothetical protein AAF485_31960 [Chloroflexota bacterium]